MAILKKQIKEIADNPYNRRINDLSDRFDFIEDISVTPLLQKRTKIQATYNIFSQKHACEIIINNGIIEKHSCDCRWHSNKYYCPHIYDLVMYVTNNRLCSKSYSFHQDIEQKLSDERNQYSQKRKQQKRRKLLAKGNELLDKFRQDYAERINIEIRDQKIEIEAVFNDDYDEMKLTFRIGNKKKYVIKDIAAFIERLDNESDYNYGKELTLKHKTEYFDDFALAQIQFMRLYMKQPEIVYGYYEKKELPLNIKNLDEFAKLYENNGGKNFDVLLAEEKPMIKIEKDEEIFTLSFPDGNLYTFGKKHIYQIYRRNDFRRFYKYSLDESGKCAAFLEELRKQPIVFENKDFMHFYKYVLSDILPYIEIEGLEEWQEELYDEISCYGEINEDGNMILTLKYGKNGKERAGFDPQSVTSFKQDLCEAYIRQYASYIDEEKHEAVFNEEDDKTLEFIQIGFPYLSKYCTVYVSDELKAISDKRKYSFSVGVRMNNNLLEIDLDSVQIPKDELKDVLKAYRKRKKFFRLKNGELLLLDSEELKELDEFMQDHHIDEEDLNKGRAIVESYRMFGLNAASEKAKNITIQCDNKIKQRIDRFEQVTSKDYPVLPQYENILRDYQKEGIAWLSLLHEMNFNGILADDMGLGKTLQVIAFLDGLQDKKTSLVVCPSSLIYNWENEVHKFSQTLKAACITGNQKMREEKIAQWNEYDLLITSYDYMRRDIELYQETQFNYVILDEAQYIKNQKTKNAISVKKLHCDHRLALSGTPIENSLAELWSIFDFLMPDYLFNYHYFQSHYESEIVRNQNEEKQQDLRKLVSPFILRRNKKDVLKELPDKIERVQLIDFNEEESKLYLANLANVNKELQMISGLEAQDKFAILAMLTRLRQLCCEPRALYENITEPSSKLTACMELIETLKENHQKCLLFSSFTTMLDFIAEQLQKAGISYYMLTGKTNKEERQRLVNAFQQDDTTVFLISLKAGGTGLNLTAAEAVIHYDPWWNQSAQNQATDRAYRIGQNKNVQVFELVMKNSIEEKIQKMKERKKELADAIIENNEAFLKNMSQEELLELFTMD